MFLIQNRFDLTPFFRRWASLGLPGHPSQGLRLGASRPRRKHRGPARAARPRVPPPWDDRRLYDVGLYGVGI